MKLRTEPFGYNIQQNMNVGGIGYNPIPPTSFSYNGNGTGYYTSQNNTIFQNMPGSYVSSYIPNNYYNPYLNNYYNTGGPIFDTRVKLSEQFYYQNGYKPTVIGLDGKEVQLGSSYNNYYTSAWDLYNKRKQIEQEWQEHQQQQQEIIKRLTILNRKYLGYNDGEEVYKQQEKNYQQFMIKQYEINNMQQQYDALQLISYLPKSCDNGYINYQQNDYVNRWNKLFQERTSSIPEHVSLYDFFNGAIGNQMYINMIKEQALDRMKDLSNLYNQNEFRQQLAKSNPNYDPLTGSASGSLSLNSMSGNRRLNIDDMEITLPPSIANDAYAKKREKFMNTILSNMQDNISSISNKQYMEAINNGFIPNR